MKTDEPQNLTPWLYDQWDLKQHKYSSEFAPWLSSVWESYLIGPDDLTLIPAIDDVNVICGIYFLWDAEGALLYIGQSIDVPNRLISHSRYGQSHAFVSAIEVKAAALDEIESAYIFALTPPNNRKYSQTGWCLHDSMVERIKNAWHPIK